MTNVLLLTLVFAVDKEATKKLSKCVSKLYKTSKILLQVAKFLNAALQYHTREKLL